MPPEVFTTPFTNPGQQTPAAQRDNLRQALKLLADAGWQLKGTQLVNTTTGKPFSIEYLLDGATFEKVGLAYQTALKKIGIDLQIREVDTAQYENRVRSRDFDLIYAGWAQSMSPGNEQIDFFGSESANREGSRNYGAVSDPGVDALIQDVLHTADRDGLIAATKALDRVLLWNRYVVPGWTLRAARIARWDRFSHPDPLPQYSIGFQNYPGGGSRTRREAGQGGTKWRRPAASPPAADAPACRPRPRALRRSRPSPGPPERPGCTACRSSAI